ncbi:MAG TPA: hypothetical protein VHZ56_12365, partial [Devosia sp.]|nr:hypothetical protein [Devosia sp.]
GTGLTEAQNLARILGGLGTHLETLSNETEMISGALDEGSGAIGRLDRQVGAVAAAASQALALPARRRQRADAG